MIHTTIKKILICISLVLILVPTALFAQDDILISDILQNPARFLNKTVTISGRVDTSYPPQGTTPGYYMLVDDSLESIPVSTFTPPGPGSQITVEGVVLIEEATGQPFIQEKKIVSGSPLLLYAIIAGIVVIVLIIILVIILRRPTPARQPALATTPGLKGAPPRTEKLSEVEARSLAGRPKTEKIPGKPAQLSVLTGEKKGEDIFLVTENIIGSDKGNIRLKDRGVSGEHARINFVGGKYILTNVSLTNPTMINGKAVEGDYELKDKDEILMGTVKVKFALMK
ncbi:MAG: FHA domain-containing protein [Deltaproteobacteria bacterium]|nr:FHA domain-containing protein [Candidatus Zymogenaceae bacterium]